MSKNEKDNLSEKIQINWLIAINLNPFGTSCNIKEN